MPDYTFSKTGADINEILNRFTTPDANAMEVVSTMTFRSWPKIQSVLQYGAGLNFALSDAPEANGTYAQIFNFNYYNSGRLFFREHSGTSNGLTGFYEDYILPICDDNRTDNASFRILTTKEPVTIAQGGTGSTTAKEALDAVGGNYIFPEMTIDAGSSISITCGNISKWRSLLVLGTVGGSGGSAIVVLINDGAVSAVDLRTGNAWNQAGLVITASERNVTFRNNHATDATRITVFAG